MPSAELAPGNTIASSGRAAMGGVLTARIAARTIDRHHEAGSVHNGPSQALSFDQRNDRTIRPATPARQSPFTNDARVAQTRPSARRVPRGGLHVVRIVNARSSGMTTPAIRPGHRPKE